VYEEELEHTLFKLGGEIYDTYSISDSNSLFMAAKPENAVVDFPGA
jgi:hypothetical protein